ncbi:hypothetical protein H5410_046288, partial [Solanum commersonii]
MSPICGLINTPNLNFCLSLSKTQVQQLKKDVSNSSTQDSIMTIHNKTQFTQARINCVPKDSSCDTPLPKILKLAILASKYKLKHNKVLESNATLTFSKRRTLCMSSPIGLPVFSNRHFFQLTQDKKGLYKACNGAECK